MLKGLAVAVGGIGGLGTGVATALGVNVGSAGAFVVNGGALGTPSSGVATNLTGTAAGLTAGAASAVAVGGITGLGTGVATFLATPSSANLKAAVTDETGASGVLVFAGTPSFLTTIGVGAAAAAASGAGITFPATASASSDANTLDDYEEGTWTATVGAGSISSQTSAYTKIGRLCSIQATIAYGGSGANDANITGGLPFAAGFRGAIDAVGLGTTATATMTTLGGIVLATQSSINLYSYLPTAGTLGSVFQSAGNMDLAGTYEV